MKSIYKTFVMSLLSTLGLNSCAQNSLETTVIQNFELNKYLGTWYEIARLDHSFEHDLSQVTANYSMRTDGKVKVINRSFNNLKNTWSESVGKAIFAGDNTMDSLKVSFFGPSLWCLQYCYAR